MEPNIALPRVLIGTPSRRRMLVATLKLVDLSALLLAFLGAALLVAYQAQSLSLDRFLSVRLTLVNVGMLLGLLLVWHLSFAAFRHYDVHRPLITPKGMIDVLRATGICTLLVALCGAFFQVSIVTAPFLLVFWIGGAAVAIASRFLLSAGMQLGGHSWGVRRRVLVSGTGPRALRFAQAVERDPESGCRVIGFVDEPWSGMADFRRSGHYLVAEPKHLGVFLRDTVVDEMIVALPSTALREQGSALIAACEEHGVTVRLLSNVLDDLGLGALERELFDDDVMVTVYNGAVEGWPLLVKRILDVSLALVLLLVLAPLFLVTAIAIRATSPGPILFAQQRIGYNKRRFYMLKFRTMTADAEERLSELECRNEASGPVFKLADDPRITPLGRLLRRTSIDELPQLINVLKGEMSLVGPRPLPLRDVSGFDENRHRRRFSVRPGMTGLWQVSGRSSLPFERWMELDLQYIDEWSLGLDLRILARTIPAVIREEGAL